MAKKRVEQPDDEQEPVEYDDVEPEVVEDEPIPMGAMGMMDFTLDDVITKPGGAAVSLDTPKDEPTYRVSFALPYGVLVALLDPSHADADVQGAFNFGLIYDDIAQGNEMTPLGHLVLAGFDQTAVRHKMTAAWREHHNRGVGGVK